MIEIGGYRVLRELASGPISSRYQLDSGRWLLRYKPPNQLSPTKVVAWLGAVRRLSNSGHSNLATFVEASSSDEELLVILEDPQATPLSEHCRRLAPSPHQLLNWALQLSAVACHLVEQEFPLGAGFPRLEHLWLKDTQLLVLDPGLEDLFAPETEPIHAAISRFGALLRELGSNELPANLEWVAARCQADRDLAYHDFDEVHQALHATMIVEVPEVVRLVSKAALPPVPNFEVPALKPASRPSWGKAFLAMALVASIGWGLLLWWRRPEPPRDYPAAVLTYRDELWLLDLSSGRTRRKIKLDSDVITTRLVGDWLLVQCQGARRLLALHSRTFERGKSPMIDANPDSIATDPSGKWLYLLYAARARVLIVQMPNTPTAYLDIPPDSGPILPVPGSGLLVATRTPPLLRYYSAERRVMERERPLSGIDQLALDNEGRCWTVLGDRLEALNSDLKTVETYSLPAATGALACVGARLVCAQTTGLAVVEEQAITSIALEREPRCLQADGPDRVWLLQDDALIAVDLVTHRQVLRWPLLHPFQNLTLLP